MHGGQSCAATWSQQANGQWQGGDCGGIVWRSLRFTEVLSAALSKAILVDAASQRSEDSLLPTPWQAGTLGTWAACPKRSFCSQCMLHSQANAALLMPFHGAAALVLAAG